MYCRRWALLWQLKQNAESEMMSIGRALLVLLLIGRSAAGARRKKKSRHVLRLLWRKQKVPRKRQVAAQKKTIIQRRPQPSSVLQRVPPTAIAKPQLSLSPGACPKGVWEGTKIAHIHIPKCAGSSLLHWFSMHNETIACNMGTSGIPGHLCSCSSRCCLQSVGIAIMETSHASIREHFSTSLPGQHILYTSIIRSPEAWFYSAVGQFCTGKGMQSPVCKSGVTFDTLRKTAKWFEPEAATTQSIAPTRGALRYFIHANFQSFLLGDVFEENHFCICTLEDTFPDFFAKLFQHVLFTGKAHQAARRKSPIKFPRFNSKKWIHISKFRQRIPWHNISRYYQLDLALWNRLHAHGGCMAYSSDPYLRDKMLGNLLRHLTPAATLTSSVGIKTKGAAIATPAALLSSSAASAFDY